MAKESKRWITVNGRHILINDDGSVDIAFAKKEREIFLNKEQADRLNHKEKKETIPVSKSIYGVTKKHVDGWWEDLSYYKEGEKEWHEPEDYYVPNYTPEQQEKFFDKYVVANSEQKKALKEYARGSYHSDKDNSKNALADKYNLESVIDNSKKLHLGDATLFRGADLTDSDYNKLLKGDTNIDFLNKVTSWSLREDVAHMYAQGDPYTGDTYRKLHGDNSKGHKVIFIEEHTNDSMALPFAPAHNESLRSSRAYTITKIVPKSQYKKVGDIYSSKGSGFNEPVTYIYVTSKKK